MVSRLQHAGKEELVVFINSMFWNLASQPAQMLCRSVVNIVVASCIVAVARFLPYLSIVMVRTQPTRCLFPAAWMRTLKLANIHAAMLRLCVSTECPVGTIGWCEQMIAMAMRTSHASMLTISMCHCKYGIVCMNFMFIFVAINCMAG